MIEKNMLRDRAECLPTVTDEMWQLVCEHNRDIVEEFLYSNKQLSTKTLKQYTSGLRIFFNFVREKLNNKPLYKITKRDFIKYFAFLQDHNLSSSALGFKKSAVSSLCNYIENIVAEEEEDYKNFRNPTKAINGIPKNSVYEKVKITQEEYDLMIDTLIKKESYMVACFVAVAFNTAARRNEIRQFKSEIVNYEKQQGKNYIESHVIYGKGKGGGKILRYMVNDEAIKYIKLWLDNRGYNHEYVFTAKYRNGIKQVSESWFNDVCKNELSNILGRRINVHLFKSSAITALLEKGVDIKIVSKYIAHHESVSTTDQFYNLMDDTESKNKIFD